MPKRYEWLDVAKGICIVLMILGHTSIPEIPKKWIYTFHMPFFFFASGLVANFDIKERGAWIKRRAGKLLVPCAIYAVITSCAIWIAAGINLSDGFMRMLVTGLDGPLWFVPVLFAALVVMAFVKREHVLYAVFASFAVAYFLNYNGWSCAWALSTVPAAIGFVGLGRLVDIMWLDRLAELSLSKYRFISGSVAFAFLIGGG